MFIRISGMRHVRTSPWTTTAPRATSRQRTCWRGGRGHPHRARSEVGGGPETTADSSATGCVKERKGHYAFKQNLPQLKPPNAVMHHASTVRFTRPATHLAAKSNWLERLRRKMRSAPATRGQGRLLWSRQDCMDSCREVGFPGIALRQTSTASQSIVQ